MKHRNILIFLTGILTGAAGCFTVISILGEERIKKIFKKNKKEKDSPDADASENQTDDPCTEEEVEENQNVHEESEPVSYNKYFNIASEYTADTEDEDEEEDEEIQVPSMHHSEGIYQITPDEFNENSNYCAITLTYYADGVITDRSDNIVHNVEELIGDFIEDDIGRYDPDQAYIRNEYLKTDFNIERNLRTYEEILKEKPYLRDQKEEDEQS